MTPFSPKEIVIRNTFLQRCIPQLVTYMRLRALYMFSYSHAKSTTQHNKTKQNKANNDKNSATSRKSRGWADEGAKAKN